jgi:hypothetical protein
LSATSGSGLSSGDVLVDFCGDEGVDDGQRDAAITKT